MVVACLICRSLKSSLDKLLQNYFPLSLVNSTGHPKRQIHFSKSDSATIRADLFGMAKISAYLVKASFIQRTYVFPWVLVRRGPIRSIATR